MTTFRDFYDEQWVPRDEYFAFHRRRFFQTWDFIRSLNTPSRGVVLDVAGVGPISSFLAEARGWEAHETKTDLRGPLPLQDNAYDLVICTETIEHIKDVDTSDINELEHFNYSGILHLLSELKRVIKPDGQIIVTTPNANSYLTLQKWLIGDNLVIDPGHVRELSVDDFSRVVSTAGLIVRKLVTMDSWADSLDEPVRKLRRVARALLAESTVDRKDNIVAALAKS